MQEHDTSPALNPRFYRKDGSIIWISEKTARAIRDAQASCFTTKARSRTSRPQREAERNCATPRRSIIRSSRRCPKIFSAKNLQERFTFANQAILQNARRHLAEILGKTDFDFFPAELAVNYQRDDSRVMATGRSYETVEEHQLPDGPQNLCAGGENALARRLRADHRVAGDFLGHHTEKLAEAQIRKATRKLAISREQLRSEKPPDGGRPQDGGRESSLTMLPQQLSHAAAPGDSRGEHLPVHAPLLPTGTSVATSSVVTALRTRKWPCLSATSRVTAVRSRWSRRWVRALSRNCVLSRTSRGSS